MHGSSILIYVLLKVVLEKHLTRRGAVKPPRTCTQIVFRVRFTQSALPEERRSWYVLMLLASY